jgi:DNA-binding transcriptional regulator YhcF (GntR family)
MSKMNQTESPIESPLPGDVYPIVRVATEFFLRSFDLLGQLHEDMVSGLIVMTRWHRELANPGRRAMGIRELSRKLDLPYETVRRHVRQLELGGSSSGSTAGKRNASILRRIYVDTVRLLNDLARIEVLEFKTPKSSRLRTMSKEQMAIAVAGMGLIITCMTKLREAFGDDLMKGIVFTAIRAANIKHYTNTSPAAHRSILPDVHRLPVSVLAISQSLRLPYETVRRHADILVKEGTCIRVGRRGLMVPESAFRPMTTESITVRQVVMAFIAELRAAGVKVRR